MLGSGEPEPQPGEGEPTPQQAEVVNPLLGAPEGDYDLGELPDGMVLDKDALAQVTPLAKEIGLSAAGLKRLAVEARPIVENQVLASMAAQVAGMRAASDRDAAASITGGLTSTGETRAPDPVFAGKTVPQVQAVVARALDRFAGDHQFPGAKPNGEPGTFRDWLNTTGLAMHPAMLRFCYLAGEAISEDSDFVRGGTTPKTALTREEKYYGPGAR